MRINYYILFFLITSLPYSLKSQEADLLEQIKEIKEPTEQLQLLEEALSKSQLSNPKIMHPYAKAYDSIAKTINEENILINAINFNGNAHYANEEYEKAIIYYLDATKILEKKPPTKRLSQIYNNLAGCYRVRSDFKNTEKYFSKALDIAYSIKDNPWIANLKNNLAVVYMDEKLFKKADEMYEDALDIYRGESDTLMMGITHMNQGNSRISSKNYQNAITQYETSQKYVPISFVPLLHAVSETGIGIAHTELGNYDKALPYLERGKELAKKIKHTEQLMESYTALSSYHATTNDYKNAFTFQKKSQKIKDSITASEQDKNLADALTRYETEKKDAQLKVFTLEAEKTSQEKQLYLIIGIIGVISTILIGFFLYKNKKKNKLLAKQKTLLEATIDEKNALLKETHHRVKNSFQIVSSLLYLQSENMQDKEAQLAIKEAQNRVRSMVLIHQKLYNKDQLVGINSKEYIEDLTQDIFESHQFTELPINYSLEVKPMILDIETITPIGLILNELITNVLKHAFDEVDAQSKIHIAFESAGENLLLKVSDNGKGMTKEIKETSFGIKLIKALSKKLKAKLIYSGADPKGTLATLEITRFQVL